MKKVTVHLKTVLKHKKEVFKLMSKVGMPIQGLLHDMSKFTPIEFMESIKYATGTKSPLEVSREVNGYSAAWLHHKGHNKHHWEYWMDRFLDGGYGCMMPYRYAVEMVCDMIAASTVYKGKDYTSSCPLEYFKSKNFKRCMHPNTYKFLDIVFTEYKSFGEDVLNKKNLQEIYSTVCKKD